MRSFSLDIRGRLLQYGRPAVMGILNATPDSFHSQSRVCESDAVRRRTESMLAEGADFIDVGACSTRPGATLASEDEELRRLEPVLKAVRSVSTDVPVSVDTFRASVARRAVAEMGADIINDISGGEDPEMWQTVADLKAPYVLMHMSGTTQNMHVCSNSDDIMTEVVSYFSRRLSTLRLMGVCDIILDPGFGFGKTLDQNYVLLSQMRLLKAFGAPLLAGVSRKSMVTRLLDIDASEALNGTTAINMVALDRGAAILRVHDVASAVQAVKIHTAAQSFSGRVETI